MSSSTTNHVIGTAISSPIWSVIPQSIYSSGASQPILSQDGTCISQSHSLVRVLIWFAQIDDLSSRLIQTPYFSTIIQSGNQPLNPIQKSLTDHESSQLNNNSVAAPGMSEDPLGHSRVMATEHRLASGTRIPSFAQKQFTFSGPINLQHPPQSINETSVDSPYPTLLNHTSLWPRNGTVSSCLAIGLYLSFWYCDERLISIIRYLTLCQASL